MRWTTDRGTGAPTNPILFLIWLPFKVVILLINPFTQMFYQLITGGPKAGVAFAFLLGLTVPVLLFNQYQIGDLESVLQIGGASYIAALFLF